MSAVLCKVSDGARPSEATVEVRDYSGRPQYMPLERDFLHQDGDRFFVPVFLMQVDKKRKAAFVQLPVEADSGAHGIWVRLSDLEPDDGAPA